MKIRLSGIAICLFVFSFLYFPFISDLFAASKRKSAGSNIESIIIKDSDRTKIVSSGKLECKNRNLDMQSKRQKKITICPVNDVINNGILSISSRKFLATYFYKVRNLIYIVCCIFLIFIWARIRWQKFPEWKLFYSVFIILIINTIASGIVGWYFIPEDLYLYYCQKPNVLWMLCKKGKHSITVSRKNLIVLDSNGKVLKTRFLSDKFRSRYKVNMFY